MSQQSINDQIGAASIITDERVLAARRARYNPLRLLDFNSLAQMIDLFKYGTLDRMARTQADVCESDDTLVNVIAKRKAAVQRMDWVVHVDPESLEDPEQEAEANKHKEQLEFFFKHMRVTDAIDKDQIGRFSLLKQQMMNAVVFKFQVHEIIWRPMPGAMDGRDGLTATFKAAPLQFFENRTGEMRYIPWEGAYEGIPFENDGQGLPNWLVTTGTWLGRALVIAYLYKRAALQPWVFFCDRHGSPAIIGKTKSVKGSDIWNSFVDALKQVSQNFSAIIYAEDELESVDLGGSGDIPYPKLVERMDRAMAAILMGGDLSSLSRDNNAAGSNPQMDESIKLEDGDAELISETLNLNVCRYVLEWYNGPGTIPRAYVQIISPKRKDAVKDLAVDQFLLASGAKLGMESTLERYDREPARKGEEVLQAAAKPAGTVPDDTGKQDDDSDLSNERADVNATLRDNSLRKWSDAQSRALTPLWDRLDAVFHVADNGDDQTFLLSLNKLIDDIPSIQRQAAKYQQPGRVLAGVVGANVVNGMAEGEVTK